MFPNTWFLTIRVTKISWRIVTKRYQLHNWKWTKEKTTRDGRKLQGTLLIRTSLNNRRRKKRRISDHILLAKTVMWKSSRQQIEHYLVKSWDNLLRHIIEELTTRSSPLKLQICLILTYAQKLYSYPYIRICVYHEEG